MEHIRKYIYIYFVEFYCAKYIQNMFNTDVMNDSYNESRVCCCTCVADSAGGGEG